MSIRVRCLATNFRCEQFDAADSLRRARSAQPHTPQQLCIHGYDDGAGRHEHGSQRRRQNDPAWRRAAARRTGREHEVTAPVWLKSTVLFAITFVGGAVAGVSLERRRTPAHDASRADSHHAVQRLVERQRGFSGSRQGCAPAPRSAFAIVVRNPKAGSLFSEWWSTSQCPSM